MKYPFLSIPPGPLFILGLLTVPAFLFQKATDFRILETVIFLLLAVLSGKKVRLIPPFLLLLSVTGASLLVPYGRVLTNVFGLPITSGALEAGLSRGTLLLGLLYLSKFSVRRGLVFPGKIGSGIGKVFFYFERFSDSREKLSLKDLPAGLDNLLIAVSASGEIQKDATAGAGDKKILLLVPLFSLIICWVLLFWSGF